MVSVIQADVGGLQVMAGRFDRLAGQVAAVSMPGGVRLSGQATSAAVNAVHAGATAAVATLAARVQAMSAKVATGATAHAAREADSATALAALTPPPATAV